MGKSTSKVLKQMSKEILKQNNHTEDMLRENLSVNQVEVIQSLILEVKQDSTWNN